MTAEPLVTCPRCGHAALKRLLGGGGGVIFKGSGFYLTDYRKKGEKEKPSSPPSKNKDEKGVRKIPPLQNRPRRKRPVRVPVQPNRDAMGSC